jgi:hypothetical protein
MKDSNINNKANSLNTEDINKLVEYFNLLAEIDKSLKEKTSNL